MHKQLNREWLPDSERMRSTTEWILRREPLLIRIAPLAFFLFVAGLAAWSTYAQVGVYETLPGRVIAIDRSHADTLAVQIDTDVRLESGMKVIVLSSSTQVGRGIEGHIVAVERWNNGGTPRTTASITVPAASQIAPGRVVVRIQVAEKPVISELFTSTGMRKKAR